MLVKLLRREINRGQVVVSAAEAMREQAFVLRGIGVESWAWWKVCCRYGAVSEVRGEQAVTTDGFRVETTVF